MSAATIPQRKLAADRLAAAIHTAMTDTSLGDNAQRLAERVAEEDGAGRVLATIESLTNTSREVP